MELFGGWGLLAGMLAVFVVSITTDISYLY